MMLFRSLSTRCVPLASRKNVSWTHVTLSGRAIFGVWQEKRAPRGEKKR